VDEVELRDESRRPLTDIDDTAPSDAEDARDVAAVATAVRALSADEDPVSMRRAICQIALQLTEADAASVLDLVGEDLRLLQSAVAGRAWELPRTLLADDGSPAAAAYRAGRAKLTERSPRPGAQAPQRLGGWPATAYWQPLALGGRSSAAVLALGWESRPGMARPRLARLAGLVAAEATVILERVDLLAQLAGLARTDELTGLPNRRAVHEELTRGMQRAKRDGTSLCVALLDLDFFKAFNDTQGHQAGDRMLADAAAAWREALRAGSDTIGRYGGEEFLVVVPAAPKIALATVERLRAATPRGQTVSAGLAAWDGRELASALVGRADVALYRAKARGRDQTVAAGSGETSAAPEPSDGRGLGP
jgi:diguanylate cyclase (GGDEF)-like protein